ncbi:hypothetical protein GYA44_02535 [Candidatus Microgenomates bacterium]|nr:hypothetical protein [Candidatus Microgenomates bacterium]
MVTAGEILKNKREKLGKSLDLVSQETKIQKRFLEYVEADDYSNFESEVFLIGFIKIYSKYLDLDTDKILALYRRSYSSKKRRESEKKKNSKFKFSDITAPTPKIIITSLLIIFAISILGYVGYQIYKFQSPPTIAIISPEDNLTVPNESIKISGTTTPNTTITINDIPTDVNSEGYFEKEIKLKEGQNNITIKGKKNSNNILETTQIRKITYTPIVVEEEQKQETEEKSENKITLEIVGTAAWIKLDIDDKNKLSEVVQPSKKDFPITKSFYLITGRVSDTKIYFNGKLISWKNTKTAGVAEMRCNIVEKTIECE